MISEDPIQTTSTPPAPLREHPPGIPVPVTIQPTPRTEDAFLTNTLLFDAAFGPGESLSLTFGGLKSTPRERAIAELEQANKNPAFHYYSALDSATGEVIGFAKWYFVHDPHIQHWPVTNPDDLGPGLNRKLYDAYFGEMRRRREKIYRDKNEDYVYMCVLVTDPAAQRRGVGKKLLQAGLKEVDKAGLECFINASPEGKGLYSKFGWEDVTHVTVDLKEYGGTTTSTIAGLIRKPGAKATV